MRFSFDITFVSKNPVPILQKGVGKLNTYTPMMMNNNNTLSQVVIRRGIKQKNFLQSRLFMTNICIHLSLN